MAALSSNWDLSRVWGSAPKLNGAALLGAVALAVKGLGTGTLPVGAVFRLAGTTYELTGAAVISGGLATLPIDPPLAANAADNLALTDFDALCCDADLTAQDSAQPALAKRVVDAGTGATAYDNKRALVKRDIAAWLVGRGTSPSGIQFPWQFNRAATLLELAYIYQDLSKRNEGIANEKAAMFLAMYEREIERAPFDYVAPIGPPEVKQMRTTAILWRA